MDTGILRVCVLATVAYTGSFLFGKSQLQCLLGEGDDG